VPGRDLFVPFPVDSLGQNSGGGRPIARDLTGLAGNFADHLRADVLEAVVEFDFLGHGHAVLGG
jgi:hypothetical protein